MIGSAAGMVESFFEYISHTFTPSATDDDAQFEERFKYFICTSPFLNKNATLQTVRDQRIVLDTPVTSAISSAITPARFGLTVGAGSFALLFMRMVIARVNVKGWSWLQPALNRITNGVFALVSSAWLYRMVQKRRSQTLYNQALQSLQRLVHQCQTLDVKVNRAITSVQDLETLSRTQRLSTNMTSISRLELASRMRHCNNIRAQLAVSLLKSGSLFQQSTETLQSHIDHKRLSTLLDMYNISPSSRSSPIEQAERRASLNLLPPDDLDRTNDEPSTPSLPDTPSPTSALYPNNHCLLPRPNRSRTLNTGSNRSKRSSFQGSNNMTIATGNLEPPSRRRLVRRHTSWSSDGEESDSGSMMSPRSSVYTHTPSSLNPTEALLLALRKDFQRMHGFRREFLCELLSIRKKSQRGHTGVNALKDYDRNWIVVRNVLQKSVNGIATIVSELNKALVFDPHLSKMDTFGLGSFDYDIRFQPFAQRLSSLELRIKDVQTKLYICQDDIKDSTPDQPDAEKQQMLESQFNSISQDIAVLAAEWQQGQLALGSALRPHATDLASPTSASVTTTAVGTPEPGKSRASIEDRLSRISFVADSVDADESGDSGLGVDTVRRSFSGKGSPSSPSSSLSFSASRERLHRRNLQVRHSVEMLRKSNEIWREYDQQQLLHQQQQPQRHLQLQMSDGQDYTPPYQPRSSSLAHRRTSSNRNSAVFEGEVSSIESTSFREQSESISPLSPNSPSEFPRSME
ncbi:hypothetical protein MVEG_08733 [Podila verticillata NRRL 6337]|nr:hypothetical protein MVEG_08733 [Podila verticillata NRRL 6337]